MYNSLLGVHSKEYAGLKPSGTFTYADLDNHTFVNSTPTIATIDYPVVDTIYTDSAYTFTWTGSPIAANETITLTIDGTQQSNFEVVSSSTEGATELIIPASKLQNLGIGDATFTLQRAHNTFSVVGTSTGGRMALWYTTQKTIYIE